MSILSHNHKFIFVAVPKVASHSIRFALREHLNSNDEEQVFLFVNKKINRPIFSDQEHGHQLAKEIKQSLGDCYDDYFSFAFVRNPWDRFISYVSFIMRFNGDFTKDPRGTMKRVLDNPQNQHFIHFRSQSDYVTDLSGNMIVSKIYRYEKIQEHYNELCEQLKISSTQLKVKNPSNHSPYHEYYDNELRDMVHDRYKDDVNLFNYNFE